VAQSATIVEFSCIFRKVFGCVFFLGSHVLLNTPRLTHHVLLVLLWQTLSCFIDVTNQNTPEGSPFLIYTPFQKCLSAYVWAFSRFALASFFLSFNLLLAWVARLSFTSVQLQCADLKKVCGTTHTKLNNTPKALLNSVYYTLLPVGQQHQLQGSSFLLSGFLSSLQMIPRLRFGFGKRSF
jgi:hypothetical protein